MKKYEDLTDEQKIELCAKVMGLVGRGWLKGHDTLSGKAIYEPAWIDANKTINKFVMWKRNYNPLINPDQALELWETIEKGADICKTSDGKYQAIVYDYENDGTYCSNVYDQFCPAIVETLLRAKGLVK